MKRTTTILEQKLIANGWYLAAKTYWGKKSEKTFCYEYQKQDETRHVQVIKLNSKKQNCPIWNRKCKLPISITN